MPSSSWASHRFPQARKDKQAEVPACLSGERRGEAEPASRPGPGEKQARKDKQAIHWPFVLPLMRRANCSWTKGQ